ncbi:hypothetical protein NE237_026094 [Protea cynaroides]|uniref:Uncharacterized protein n=1 Tax=Protea cynaroides TaxID=273540 RepID=A0A9Q0K2E2_9MAGN|nr:hypothetical protein NE237_026094 [Protea cynaroides]
MDKPEINGLVAAAPSGRQAKLTAAQGRRQNATQLAMILALQDLQYFPKQSTRSPPPSPDQMTTPRSSALNLLFCYVEKGINLVHEFVERSVIHEVPVGYEISNDFMVIPNSSVLKKRGWI